MIGTKRKRLIVHLETDSDADSPCEEDGWKVYSFCTRHADFKDPEELGLSLEQHPSGQPIVLDKALKKKLSQGLAFFLSYYEHSLCRWWRNGAGRDSPDMRWDGHHWAGLLVWAADASHLGAKTYRTRAKSADALLECYTDWCNGSVYMAGIQVDGEDQTEWLGTWYNCDLKDMFATIRQATEGALVRLEGDSTDLADFHSVGGKVVEEFEDDEDDREEDRPVVRRGRVRSRRDGS